MICMRIYGGLGNQMYQYALGRSLCKDHPEELQLDLSWFNEHDGRGYELDKFHIAAHPCTNRFVRWYLGSRHRHTMRRLLRPFLTIVKQKSYVVEPDIVSLKHKKGNYLLDGYFQYFRYFDDIRDLLKKEFTLRPALSPITRQWMDRIKNDPAETVFLHVRRGDYLNAVNTRIYAELSPGYYERCIASLRQKHPNLSLYIFSNDMEWAKENLHFDGLSVHYVTGNDEVHGYEDMALMRKCRHHVTANSTFSWWGAYLADQSGETYAPSAYFNPGNDPDSLFERYPEDWHVIDI